MSVIRNDADQVVRKEMYERVINITILIVFKQCDDMMKEQHVGMLNSSSYQCCARRAPQQFERFGLPDHWPAI